MTNREQMMRALNEWSQARLRLAVRADALARAQAYHRNDIAQTRMMYAYQAAQRLLNVTREK
jgi:hypothetical protein